MNSKSMRYQFYMLMFAVMAFCVSACAEGGNGKFIVHGKNANSISKLFVANLNTNKWVDTLQVENGEFTFVDNKSGEDVYYAFVDNNAQMVVVNDGENVELDVASHKATGTPLNDKLSELTDKMDSLFNAYGQIKKQYDAAKNETEKAKFVEQLSGLENSAADIIMKMIDENQSNSLPAYLLTKVYENMDFEKLDSYAKSGASYTKHPIFNFIKQYIEYVRPNMALIGKMFTDVEGADFDGKSHKLSEFVGKGNYVLVDFWASWCGPCMAEMPNVKACWDKYKSKGFEVVGISLDNDAAKWKAAVHNGGYEWKHMSDLGGWKSTAAAAYGVQSIPWNFLCDGGGKIIAVSLRGNQLQRKLEELYK